MLFLCVYHTHSSQNYVVLDIPIRTIRVICGEKNMGTSKTAYCFCFFVVCNKKQLLKCQGGDIFGYLNPKNCQCILLVVFAMGWVGV